MAGLLLGWILITASQAMNIEHPQMSDHEHDASQSSHIQLGQENLYHSRRAFSVFYYQITCGSTEPFFTECYQNEALGEIHTPCPPQQGVEDPPEIR